MYAIPATKNIRPLRRGADIAVPRSQEETKNLEQWFVVRGYKTPGLERMARLSSMFFSQSLLLKSLVVFQGLVSAPI